jgi:hypothetical protein
MIMWVGLGGLAWCAVRAFRGHSKAKDEPGTACVDIVIDTPPRREELVRRKPPPKVVL